MAHTDLDAHMPLSTNSGPGRLEKKHLMHIALLLIIHHSMHGLPATRLSEHAATPVPLGHVRIRRVQILLLQPSPDQARHRKLGTRGCSSRAVQLHILQARLCNAVATAINTGGLSIKSMQGKPTQNALQSKTTGRAIQPKSPKLACH